MEYIRRKVYLSRSITPRDSNGDGSLDSLTLTPTTKVLQIPLTNSYDDIGLFDVSDNDSTQIIDVSSIFGDTIVTSDIIQPKDDIGPVIIDWGGGGGTGGGIGNEDVIEYCSDVSANNGVKLTQSSDGWLFNPNDGDSTLYSYPAPTFIPNNTLCTYPDYSTLIGGGGGGTGTATIKNFFTRWNFGEITWDRNRCNWSDKSSWSKFESTAKSEAIKVCKANGFSDTLDWYNVGPLPGDCNGGRPFKNVKHRASYVGTCCTKYDDDGKCTKSHTTYLYQYCFYCK
jgi:hypothetical protein